MPETIAGDPRRSTRDGARPGAGALALRPLGYLLLGFVWLTIWVVALLIPVGSAAYVLTDEAVVEGLRDRFSNPADTIGMLAIVVPVMTLVMGPGAIWHLPTASWPLMVLSFAYVGRSLRATYAREKLSFTAHAPRGSTFGPPTVGDVAMSLQPVRRTRFTDAVMRFYVAGWTFDGAMFLAMLPAGLAWCTVIAGLFPGLSTAARAAFLVLTAGLVLTSVILGVRAFRRRFARSPAASPRRVATSRR
jgi:hypothetical protein